MNPAEQRWRECPECKLGDPVDGACSDCGVIGATFHQYPMQLMAMSLPGFNLHVEAHETLVGKRLCSECSSKHHQKTVQELFFDKQTTQGTA